MALTFYLQHKGRIKSRVEELDHSIIVAGGKTSMPFFQRVMNSFGISYVVLHDLDIEDEMKPANKENKEISDLLTGNRLVTFPVKLEKSFNYKNGHFKDQYDAYLFFENYANFTDEAKSVLDKVIDD
ncbi:hypothetical protein IH992_22380 [Candidatus Poribacteria bacterium]|nr:hypothetical protein [Candidatus Poribacteria bacterium]